MNDLVKSSSNELIFNDDQVNLIKSQIAVGATDDELKLFMHVASKSGLDPFAKQIYAIKRKVKENGKYIQKMTIQTGIDGFRLIAHRTGQCLSITDPKFEYRDKSLVPLSATVTVRKIVGAHIGEFTATAFWNEYYGDGRSYMANSKPRTMLGKCAETLALRKAFPAEMSGLRSEEEMVMADIEEVKVKKEVEVIEKSKDDPELKKTIIESIKDEVSIIWKNLSPEHKLALLKDILKVEKLSELNKYSIRELGITVTDLNKFIKGLRK